MFNMQNDEQSAVMNLDEVCTYLLIGKTNARTFLKEHKHDFVIHIGNRSYFVYGKITIRNQKTRWESCSGKGNLNFNCLLMLMPPEVIDYVVVHELCHRKEMNHSKAFWKEVEKILPNYKEAAGWLKKEGRGIIRRMG